MGMVKRIAKTVLLTLGAVFLSVQAIRPAKTNPPVDPARTLAARTHMTPAVQRLLARACHDCHSDQTRWPWYSDVAPVMWLVRNDVQHARSHLNFSEWDRYDTQAADELLKSMCTWTKRGRMPLPIYLRMHPDAQLSAADVQLLCAWTEQERQRLGPGKMGK